MASTYDFLGKVTATGSSTVMTLSGLDQTYQDIEFIVQAKTASTSYGASGADVILNSDTSSSYSSSAWGKNGTGFYHDQYTKTHFDINYGQGPGNNDKTMGFYRLYIASYASAVDHPGFFQNTSWDTNAVGGMWWGGCSYAPSTAAAITSITWTGIYQIEANCSICAYGINYS